MKRVLRGAASVTIPHTEMSDSKFYLLHSDSHGGVAVRDWGIITHDKGFEKGFALLSLFKKMTGGNAWVRGETLVGLVERLDDRWEIFEFDSFLELCEFYAKHPKAIGKNG